MVKRQRTPTLERPFVCPKCNGQTADRFIDGSRYCVETGCDWDELRQVDLRALKVK